MVEQIIESERPLYEAGPVAISGGSIAGSGAPENEAISLFLGLPYAAPPVGDLRWRPPQAPVPWSGLRDATAFPPSAPQPPGGVISLFGTRYGAARDEDCLYLNVWTPAREASPKMPVMVWIHGGGFRVGAADNPMYNGVNLAAKGVVVVTLNYRLNVFGGLAHPALSAESGNQASGNYALMDQIAALRWVRDNIAAFGGDADNVTIFGESAGSRSVALLVAAPHARGLFHRGICQSGALRDVSDSLAEREAMGLEIAGKLGCDKSSDPAAALRAKSWEDLHNAIAFDSNPFVDGWVVPEDPRTLYARSDIAKVPLIIGINADEATMLDGASKTDFKTKEKYEAIVRRDLGARAESVLAAYPASSDEDAYGAMMALRTDQRMTLPARQQARWLNDAGIPAYFYYFTRVPPWKAGETMGAHHGAEIAYAFGGGVRCGHFDKDADLSETDVALTEAIMRYWTSFATSGDPNHAGSPEWPPFVHESEGYLELGNDIHAGVSLRGDCLDILEGLPTVDI